MSWRIAASLIKLRDQINNTYPNRSKLSDGFIGDAAHAAVASDHNPNTSGVVCAFDITNDPSNLDAHLLANNLLSVRHPDLKYIISNHRIAGAWTSWTWWPYAGTDPHDTHIHVSVGIGPDGESKEPYDDAVDWNITDKGERMIEHEGELNALFRAFYGRMPNENEKNLFLGKISFADLITILDKPDQAERNALIAKQELGAIAGRDNWQGQIYELQSSLQRKTVDLNAALNSIKSPALNKTNVLAYLQTNLK